MPVPLSIDLQPFSGWLRDRRRAETRGMFGSRSVIVNRWRRFWLTAPRQLDRLLAATLFPPRCCLCGFEGESPDLDLCAACRDDLPWDTATAHGAVCAFRYEEPVGELIRNLKYHGALANARVLGVLLAQAVRDRGMPLPALLVPVPLHPARLRERGFNQAAAIARYAGRALGIPVAPHSVRRVRDTPSQTALDVSARQRNVHGAFATRGARSQRRWSAADHVALVDDVTTTGSTAAALGAVLHDAGVRQVDLWAVARALPTRGMPATTR
jgi:ComF family protein